MQITWALDHHHQHYHHNSKESITVGNEHESRDEESRMQRIIIQIDNLSTRKWKG